MKTIALLAVAGLAGSSAFGQAFPPTIIERGPHHRIWESVTVETDENGEERVLTGGYTELATGLHYFTNGEWLESKEQFQLFPNGAVAQEGQHQVILATDINAPASVDLLLPDGQQRLRSNPMGLSFRDTSTGQNVLLGEVTNCVGELIAPNVIVYANAFDTIRAAIRYTYSLY